MSKDGLEGLRRWVEDHRRKGYSDAALRGMLRSRGFSEVQVDLLLDPQAGRGAGGGGAGGWLVALALLFVVGLLARGAFDGGTGTSALAFDPCQEPLGWTVGAVDPRFGTSPETVRRATREAAAAWEAATGRTLFQERDDGPMAVELVFDERQHHLDEILAREQEIAALEAELEASSAEIERLRREHDRNPGAASTARVNAAIDRHNARVTEFNRRVGELNQVTASRAGDATATGAPATEAGIFTETVVERGNRRTRTRPRIHIFQFRSEEELTRLLAHELGHAIGLGHVSDPGALMRPEYTAGESGTRGRIGGLVSPADVAAFQAHCGG